MIKFLATLIRNSSYNPIINKNHERLGLLLMVFIYS